MSLQPDFNAMTREQLLHEVRRMHDLLNHPLTDLFLEGTRCEIGHQIERWGSVHDRAKQPQDWFWLLGYLGGKAMRAHIETDVEKAMHHCISSAAVLGNWYAHIILGDGEFAPGHSDLQAFLAKQFGANYAEHVTRPTL